MVTSSNSTHNKLLKTHNNPNMTRKINEEANFFVFSSPFSFVVLIFMTASHPLLQVRDRKKLTFYNLFLEKEGQKTFG